MPFHQSTPTKLSTTPTKCTESNGNGWKSIRIECPPTNTAVTFNVITSTQIITVHVEIGKVLIVHIKKYTIH